MIRVRVQEVARSRGITMIKELDRAGVRAWLHARLHPERTVGEEL